MGSQLPLCLPYIFFFVPSCDFPERIKLNNTNTNTFSSKTPVVCPFGASHLTVTNLPIRQTPFSVTVRDGSNCVHLPTYSLYPGQANISYILLQNEVSHVHEKQEVGSARRVTCLARSFFYDGRVTLLAGPTLLQPACPARTTQSRCDNQSICEHCFRQTDQMQRACIRAVCLGKNDNIFLISTLI